MYHLFPTHTHTHTQMYNLLVNCNAQTRSPPHPLFMWQKKKNNAKTIYLEFCLSSYLLWRQFLLQGQGLDLWSLRYFCCPTLERIPPPFYLIRHELMVEEYDSFLLSHIGNNSSPLDRKSTRLNSSHLPTSRMPSSA